MKTAECEQIKQMTERLIAFINWKGASFEDKKRKVIKEISLIKKYSKDCLKEAE
jgi:hypothetical protein